jgi:hypothetical protein
MCLNTEMTCRLPHKYSDVKLIATVTDLSFQGSVPIEFI